MIDDDLFEPTDEDLDSLERGEDQLYEDDDYSLRVDRHEEIMERLDNIEEMLERFLSEKK